MVSKVNWKNRGCKSVNTFVGMQFTKCSVCSSTWVKMFSRLSEKRGRKKVGRRAPRLYSGHETSVNY